MCETTSVNLTNTNCVVVITRDMITRNVIIATRLEKMQTALSSDYAPTRCSWPHNLIVVFYVLHRVKSVELM